MVTKYKDLDAETFYNVNFLGPLSAARIPGGQLTKTLDHLFNCGLHQLKYQMISKGQLVVRYQVKGQKNETHIKIDLPTADRRPKETHEIKVTFENGDSLETRINGTRQEIESYYLTGSWNTKSYPEESFSTVTDIKFYN